MRRSERCTLQAFLGALMLSASCSPAATEPSPPEAVPDVATAETTAETTPAMTTTPLFVYGLDLDGPSGCESLGEPRPMRVRGYRLAFVQPEGAEEASASLLPIRGDATVPGLVYELDERCLSTLDERAHAAGFRRTEIHVEEMARGRSAPTTPVSTYVAEGPERVPSPSYVSALRDAWRAAELDPAALEHALDSL